MFSAGLKQIKVINNFIISIWKYYILKFNLTEFFKYFFLLILDHFQAIKKKKKNYPLRSRGGFPIP